MSVFADESVDGPIIERLRASGHDVLYVAEMEPGITDNIVLDRANERHALLLTGDKDFGELVFRLGRIYAGVVLLRLAGLSTTKKVDVVDEAFNMYGDRFINAFSVITPGSVRIRPREILQ
jgi:predicted nuclease of predicted toxin-antitoxin system